MKKHRIILTKDGEVFIYKKLNHEELKDKYKAKGKEWQDWVRIEAYKQNDKWKCNVKTHFNENYPDWLERQYGYYMNKIIEVIKCMDLKK